jgi:hypothetical protein
MRAEPLEDWRVLVVARPDGFDEFVLMDDGVQLVASVAVTPLAYD